jgi:hypothetical protein
LIADYCSDKNIKGTNLVQSCNSLLTHINKEKRTFVDAFYQVRNLAVHNFRKITEIDPRFNMLDSINRDFEIVLSELLSCYKEPVNDIPSDNDLPMAWLIYQSLNETT